MSIDTSKSSITKPCLHSDGRGLPVCWDCAEEGHIQGEGEATTSSTNPTWQRFKKIRGSPRFLDGNPHTSPSHNSPQSIAPEVHPAEEGIEVGSPDTRKSQPGLIVVEGPRVVSPEEKLWKSQPRRFSTEKEAIDSRPSRLLGLQKRSFQVAVAIAFLVVGAIVIGVAVGISHKGMGYTELSMSDGDQVSSSPIPVPLMTTATISLYATSDSSTFMTVRKTEMTLTPSASPASICTITLFSEKPPSPTSSTSGDAAYVYNDSPGDSDCLIGVGTVEYVRYNGLIVAKLHWSG
ncbi:hypothetical protein F5Y16DRAFT_395661 [Xylariaceae sp. FL0255]|nr:hypothetical protein F5Y16DRAFT_395661 [Xylariaceae sp. FL0255]